VLAQDAENAQMTHRRRVAVAGGGTAGHVVTGLAFLRAYREICGAEGCFIGCSRGMEAELVTGRGEKLYLVPGSPFEREQWPGKAAALVNGVRGWMRARALLKREQIEIVIGVGGYASLGAGLAARSLGLALVLHEANAQPGRANRFLARWADRVCLGFPDARRAFPHSAVCLTGNPTGTEIAPARARRNGRWNFLVTGGSEGSPFLNKHTPEFFAALRALGVDSSVHHLTGRGDAGAVRQAYDRIGIECQVVSFSAHMEQEYARADFVIACPGAITLAEVASAGLPALLVPLSGASAHHQDANARAFSEQTGTRWVRERDWDAAVEAAWVSSLLRNCAELCTLRERTFQSARPDAAAALVRVCEELLHSPKYRGIS
jgi:UDP-N-acetylglucosamine--N-acetylmuramyl-(pentapeptide) pyrophosphoryl-undecaprenol N-acetylglucosamine transferase